MTGGRVVIIGQTGRNFAAGMSGGIAYVRDEDNTFDRKCNMEMVEISQIADEDDVNTVYSLIQEHYKYTDSAKAKKILEKWDIYKTKFKRVIPTAYKLILEQIKLEAATASNM